MPSYRYEYRVEEPWRSQQYGLLRELPVEGWRLVAVIPAEDKRKVVQYWERRTVKRV